MKVMPNYFFFFLQLRQPPLSTLFPYTTLFRSIRCRKIRYFADRRFRERLLPAPEVPLPPAASARSEEHTSELQSRVDLVCRLLLEKKKHFPNANDSSEFVGLKW